MYNYCINLKKRKQKAFCKKLNKEITFDYCKNCDHKEYKRMKTRSNKLAKLERNRHSVFTSDLDHCYICRRKRNDLHEIFGGAKRLNSIKYGLVLPLCRECHERIHSDIDFSEFWKKEGQAYWEQNIASREEFIGVFGRNYLN